MNFDMEIGIRKICYAMLRLGMRVRWALSITKAGIPIPTVNTAISV